MLKSENSSNKFLGILGLSLFSVVIVGVVAAGVTSGFFSAKDASQTVYSELETVKAIGQEAFNADGTLSSSSRQVSLTHAFLKFHELKRVGRHAEARELLFNMVQLDQSSAKLLSMLAEEYATIGDHTSALSFIAQAQKLEPKNEDIQLQYAVLLDFSKQSSEALLLLQNILKKNPVHEEALSHAVNIDVARDDYWVAIRRLDNALKVNPNLEYAHFKKGRVYSDMGKLLEAEVEFEKALKIDPNYYQAMTFLALISEEIGKVERAIKLYARLASETGNLIYHRKLGQLALTHEKYDMAQRAYENVLQNDPLDLIAHNKLLSVYMKTDKWSSVEASLKQILSIEPQNAWARVNYALTLEGHRRLEESLHHLSLIDSNSDFYKEHWLKITRTKLRLLSALQLDDQLPALLKEISTFIKDQKDPETKIGLYQALVRAQLSLSDYNEASNVLGEALTDFPKEISLMFLQGMVLEKQKKFDEGIAVMSEIIAQNPDHAGALNYVGYTWADKGKNLDEAEKFIKRALELQPEDPYILDSLGWVYYRQGRYTESYEHLVSSFLKAPNEFVVLTHLGDVLVKLGRVSEARDYYVRASHLKPDHPEDLEDLKGKIAKIKEDSPELFQVFKIENPCFGRFNQRFVSHNERMRLNDHSPGRATASSSR